MRLWGTRLVPVLARLAITAATAALLSLPAVTLAAPLGNPLNAVSDSTRVSTFVKPTGYGNLTGADGDVSSPIWAATTDLGYLTYFNGGNSTPIKQIDTGISGLTGVAYRGVDQWALSAGKTIYEGTVTGAAWHTDKTILVLGLTGDLADVDWALNAYFVPTQNDGIRKVDGDGSSTAIDANGSGSQSYDVIVFKPNTYDFNMGQIDGEGFRDLASDGGFVGGIGYGGVVDWDNTTTIRGIAYYDGGIAVVQNPLVQIHNEQAYQGNMEPLPEPATLLLLGAGGIVLVGRRFAKKGQLLVADDMKE